MLISGVSHLDHGLTPAHLGWLAVKFAGRAAFFIESVELPAELPALDCGLYGPAMGDDPVAEAAVTYAVRPGRKCASRIIPGRPARATRWVTIIAGPHDGHPCVMYTSYGGPEAPREPGDLSLGDMAQIQEARAFWAVHALASG